MATERHRIVQVAVELLDSEPGHWCTACLLPSGWLLRMVVRCGARMHLQEKRWCDECSRTDTVVRSES